MANRHSQHNGHTKDQRMRQQLAQEAARIIVEEGINDFHVAKQKAAARLHAPHTHNLPRNDEIKAALDEYQRLFKSDSQPQHLNQLRQTGYEAMLFFNSFNPRLVGPVLDGSANEYSEINLHLFSDSVEEVTFFLIDANIPYMLDEQQITMPNNTVLKTPVFKVIWKECPFELTVFDKRGLRQAPRCPVTGKVMERMGAAGVEELLRMAGSR